MKLTHRFNEALVYAAGLHARQNRKGTDIPYVSHLLAVASIVLEHGGNEDEAIAALLHDAIEDQAKNYPGGALALRRDIRKKFGDAVAEIVDGCTDADTVPKPPWRERKERYIAHIRVASPSMRLVSAADKLHNARAVLRDYQLLGDTLWSRFNPEAGKGGSLWYYREIVKALRDASSSPLIDELDRVVTELEKSAGFGKRSEGD
ncbi:MAG: phosphohydrolase [Candidatus Muproteobacteria bacterium RIFCSPHIGHO2_01_60_12]|nr:MAG: phosphohydrolase [Candidatus Muproteobacteria bacterium RIFCSPHIGHO2_01_60_12]